MLTGIICEYNPLHIGHRKQLAQVRAADPDGGIVCLMSGNFVQRGKPAIVHKTYRAQAAIRCGADLVLELPVTAALSSAEGFAAEGVRILSLFCQNLCFGAETAHTAALMSTARALLSKDFSAALSAQLETGCSFPAARQAALESIGADSSLLQDPNNILAVEYCKAILTQNSPLTPVAIHREGSYHDLQADRENPSATAVRQLMLQNGNWQDYVPEAARDCFAGVPLHSLQAGERAVLARLRTMTDEEFEALPYGSEGLWRKLMKACRQYNDLESILSAVKSKRYTRSRLDRMVMCAFLGLSAADLAQSAPYTRVLALNNRGRQILNTARETGSFPNIGQTLDHPYQAIETRCGSLYGLFSADIPEAADAENSCRIYYEDTTKNHS